MDKRSDFVVIAKFLFKSIAVIGGLVLEILFFRNYYNVAYRTGEEINLAILACGALLQIVLSADAFHRAAINNLMRHNDQWTPYSERRPAYLAYFIFAICIISMVLFLFSSAQSFVQPQEVSFIIAVVLMIINIITCTATLVFDLPT